MKREMTMKHLGRQIKPLSPKYDCPGQNQTQEITHLIDNSKTITIVSSHSQRS